MNSLLHNHNKAKHNKTVCIFLGINCTNMLRLTWHINFKRLKHRQLDSLFNVLLTWPVDSHKEGPVIGKASLCIDVVMINFNCKTDLCSLKYHCRTHIIIGELSYVISVTSFSFRQITLHVSSNLRGNDAKVIYEHIHLFFVEQIIS